MENGRLMPLAPPPDFSALIRDLRPQPAVHTIKCSYSFIFHSYSIFFIRCRQACRRLDLQRTIICTAIRRQTYHPWTSNYFQMKMEEKSSNSIKKW